MKVLKTSSENKDFKKLVKQLDDYLKEINGDDHIFYNQFNNINLIKNVIVLYEDNQPIGCGAFKKFDEQICEIKRMFIVEKFRGKGYAKIILNELENWAKEVGYTQFILETSIKLKSAINLYTNCGYIEIEKYGQYVNAKDSRCFKKAKLIGTNN